ncbi:hypothetical protein SAMN05443252_10683 [Bacillus sp. OV322]|nr:hypothetical protein SAMN05443252_10683 [Bacillus sp. OV322]
MFPWNMLFPFQKNQNDSLKNMKPQEVQSFIDTLFSQVIPQNMKGMMNPGQNDGGGGFPPFGQSPQPASAERKSPLGAEVFETHTDVYVRIPVKDPEWLKKIRIFHTSNQSIIEGIPENDDKHIITLPAIVKKKGASAHFKDHTLEIKLQKNLDLQYSEIDVSEI